MDIVDVKYEQKLLVRSYTLAWLHTNKGLENPGGKFTDNPGWRNFMSKDLFTACAQDCGFEVIHSEVVSFSVEDSDCITLLKKN